MARITPDSVIARHAELAEGETLLAEFRADRGVYWRAHLIMVRALNEMAEGRRQTLAQMALAWVLREGGITSALIGASRPEQVSDCVGAIRNLSFTPDELATIDQISLA